MTDDYKTLKCQFMHGTSHDSCLVDIYDGNKTTNTFSGSNIYQLDITTSGTYTLKVYDDIQQRDLGIEPAVEINYGMAMYRIQRLFIECCDKDDKESYNSQKGMIIQLSQITVISITNSIVLAYNLLSFQI